MNLFRVPIKGEILVCAETESEAFKMVNQMILDRLPTSFIDVGYSRPTITQIIGYLVVILVFLTIGTVVWECFQNGWFCTGGI
jgi:hypothetical protein